MSVPFAEKSNNMGCVEYAATFGSIILLILTLPFSLFWCFKVRIFIWYKKQTQFFQVVQEYERAVIFRLGRLRTGGARGPGIFFILPCVDSYCKVDLRTVSFDVPPQEVHITKLWSYFHPPEHSHFLGPHQGLRNSHRRRRRLLQNPRPVERRHQSDQLQVSSKTSKFSFLWKRDCSNSTRLLAMTTLRNILGTRNLAEVLSDREAISHAMQTSLDVATDPWGVKVERVEM